MSSASQFWTTMMPAGAGGASDWPPSFIIRNRSPSGVTSYLRPWSSWKK